MSEARWFAVAVRVNHEKTVATTLTNKGYEVFLPTYRVRRAWSDRIKEVELPVFAGYVFCRSDLSRQSAPVVATPGVVRIVGFGGRAIPVENHEIEAVRRMVDSGLAVEPLSSFAVGQHVRIAHGPLTNLEGTLIEVRKRHQFVVSVSLLQRALAVTVDMAWILPVAPAVVARCA